MLCMATEQGTVKIPQWTVGDRLRKAREAAGLGVEELATMLGRNRNSITRYERSHSVDMLVVRAYSAFTATSMTWLLTGEPPDDDGGVSQPVTLWELRDIRWGNRGQSLLKLAA